MLGHPHGQSAEATSKGIEGQNWKQLDFGTISGIFWKQFKQQQMVAGLFKLKGLRESQTELA